MPENLHGQVFLPVTAGKTMWELQGGRVRAFSSRVSTFSGRREASKLLRVGVEEMGWEGGQLQIIVLEKTSLTG